MDEDKHNGLYATAEDICSECGYKYDMASVIISNARKPKPGDFTVCFRCGHLMAFSEGLKTRELTDEEMYNIAGDPRLIALQKARLEFQLDRLKEEEQRKEEERSREEG